MMLKKRLIAVCVAMIMAVMVCQPALALSQTGVYLGVGCAWGTPESYDSHSSSYSYAGACCDAVYPKSGPDLYSAILCTLHDEYDNNICASSIQNTKLKEGTGYSSIQIKEAYLSTDTIYFMFAGNNGRFAAYADVGYIGNYAK